MLRYLKIKSLKVRSRKNKGKILGAFWIGVSFCLIVYSLIGACSGFSRSSRLKKADISGYVKTKTNEESISGARICVYSGVDTIGCTYSNSKGHYQIKGIPIRQDSVHISVMADNYVPYDTSFILSEGSQHMEGNFKLTPTRGGLVVLASEERDTLREVLPSYITVEELVDSLRIDFPEGDTVPKSESKRALINRRNMIYPIYSRLRDSLNVCKFTVGIDLGAYDPNNLVAYARTRVVQNLFLVPQTQVGGYAVISSPRGGEPPRDSMIIRIRMTYIFERKR